jgi:hypothetical protein
VGANAVERFGERRRAVELHVALRERPGGEVHVRVGEAGEDAAAAQVDDLWARKRRLVGTDAARDPVARDREGSRERERRVHRAHDAVLEDHVGDSDEGSM